MPDASRMRPTYIQEQCYSTGGLQDIRKCCLKYLEAHTHVPVSWEVSVYRQSSRWDSVPDWCWCLINMFVITEEQL